MAELTPIEEKLGEVLGLAQAAQVSIDKLEKMEGADELSDQLGRMRSESEETERRTAALVDGIDGKKTAIHEKAQETKNQANEMRDTYLADEEEVLDGLEFMTMAEAAEVGHWDIVRVMAETLGEEQTRELAEWAVGVQQAHLDGVRATSLELAAEEAREG